MSAGAGSVKAGEAYVAIGVDLSPLKAGLAKMQSAVAGAGAGLQSLGVKASIAAAAMLAPIAKSVSAFGEQEQAEVRLSAVLKATGRDAAGTSAKIIELANSMQRTTLFSDDAVISAGAVLAKFQELDAAQFPNLIQSAADLAATVGMDLPSAANLLGKALAQPEMGVALLNRQLKLFSKAEQKALQDMAASGKESEVRAILLDKLAGSTKGVAAAMGGTFTGQIQIALGLLGEIAEAVGSVVAPELAKLAALVRENIDPILEWVKENKQLVIVFAAVASGLAVIGPLLLVLGTAFGVAASAMAAVGAVIGTILSPLGLIVTAIAAAAYALVDWGKLWDSVMGGALNGVSSFSGMMKVAWAQIKSLWVTGIEGIKGAWDDLSVSFQSVLLTLNDYWINFTSGLYSVFAKISDKIKDLWNKSIGWIAEKLVIAYAYYSDMSQADKKAMVEDVRSGPAAGGDTQAKIEADRQAALEKNKKARSKLEADAIKREEARAALIAAAAGEVILTRSDVIRQELLDLVKSPTAGAGGATPGVPGVPTSSGGGVPFGTQALAFAGSLGTFSGELAGKTGFTKTEAIEKQQLDKLGNIERYTRDTANSIDDVGGMA